MFDCRENTWRHKNFWAPASHYLGPMDRKTYREETDATTIHKMLCLYAEEVQGKERNRKFESHTYIIRDPPTRKPPRTSLIQAFSIQPHSNFKIQNSKLQIFFHFLDNQTENTEFHNPKCSSPHPTVSTSSSSHPFPNPDRTTSQNDNTGHETTSFGMRKTEKGRSAYTVARWGLATKRR